MVKILASTRLSLDTYDVTVTGLSSLGYSASDQVNMRTYRIDSGGVYVDMGVVGHAIVDDFVSSLPFQFKQFLFYFTNI